MTLNHIVGPLWVFLFGLNASKTKCGLLAQRQFGVGPMFPGRGSLSVYYWRPQNRDYGGC